MVRFAQATAAVTAVAFVALVLLGWTGGHGRRAAGPAAAMLPPEQTGAAPADADTSRPRPDAPAPPAPPRRDAPPEGTREAHADAVDDPDAKNPSPDPPTKSTVRSGGRSAGAPGEAASAPREPGGPDLDDLLAAMRHVESRGDNRAVGDGGRSRGPYQISLPYWVDGGGRRSRYRRDVWSPWASRRVILGYWRRYCPAALEHGDLQTLARVHNGGPDGARERKTLRYWRRVREAMNDL